MLCNVQISEIFFTVKPTARKTDSCRFCSIKAFCDIIARIIKPIPSEKAIIIAMKTFTVSNMLCKSVFIECE